MHSDVWQSAYVGIVLASMAFLVSVIFAIATARPNRASETTCIHDPSASPPNGIQVPTTEAPVLEQLVMIFREEPQIYTILFASFAFPLGENSMFVVILLYISKRYGWSIGDVSFVLLPALTKN